jgi:hypothetical protein
MFGLFSSKEKDREKAEVIIKVIHDYYNVACAKFPNKKESFYLALVWVIYMMKHHPDQYPKDNLSLLIHLRFGVEDTLFLSSLESPDSIDALSYLMVYKEKLISAIEQEPKVSKIMSKVKITKDQVDQNEVEKVTTEIFDYLMTLEPLESIIEKIF